MAVALALVMGLLGLPTGFAGGWLFRSFRGRGVTPTGDQPAHQQAARAIATAHELTKEVKSNVGQHRASLAQAQEDMQSLADSDQGWPTLIEGLLVDNERLLAQLLTAESRLGEQQAALEQSLRESRQDALTALENRRGFEQNLAQRDAEWQRHGAEFCLAMLDVDHFKRINDQFGHPLGDEVLKGVARILGASVRPMDVVSRVGGEEFTILLPTTRLTEAQGVAERLRQAVEEGQFQAAGAPLQVTVSVGVASIGSVRDTADLLLQVDQALYAAKKAGRNRVYFLSAAGYDPVPRGPKDFVTRSVNAIAELSR